MYVPSNLQLPKNVKARLAIHLQYRAENVKPWCVYARYIGHNEHRMNRGGWRVSVHGDEHGARKAMRRLMQAYNGIWEN